MVDRIRQLLQMRQLSPTQFADTIGVARPIVSHILGGRNKPSLEVVQKIIAAFPDVAMPWLLTGQGPMLVVDVAPVVSKPAEQPSSPVTPPHTPAPVRRQAKAEKTVDAAETTRISAALNQGPSEPVRPVPVLPLEANPEPLATDAASAALLASALAPPATKPAKTIRRVLIFYSDGTFADFSPTAEAL